MHDWWLVINVAKHGRIAYIPDQLVLYRQHSNNAVGAKKVPGVSRLLLERLSLKKQHLFSLKKRILNHYRMVKKYDPTATFWSVVLKKVASKIAQKFR